MCANLVKENMLYSNCTDFEWTALSHRTCGVIWMLYFEYDFIVIWHTLLPLEYVNYSWGILVHNHSWDFKK